LPGVPGYPVSAAQWCVEGGQVANETHTSNQPGIMKKQLIRISILQSSKIATALYVLMGFIYTLIGIPMIIFGEGSVQMIGYFYLLGPIFMGVFGFIIFVVFAALYNLLAKTLGGFEFEVKNVE
jgi:ABC-type polysaccharide/polyol phosphate export permease